jgi:hypothetical protein
MNKEFVLEWIEALESGEYRQGRGSLRTYDDKYCCLGVACDLLVQKDVLPEWELHPAGDVYISDGMAASLSDEACEYIGFEDYGGIPSSFGVLPKPVKVSYTRTVYDLVQANDTFELSFKEIARILRESIKENQDD